MRVCLLPPAGFDEKGFVDGLAVMGYASQPLDVREERFTWYDTQDGRLFCQSLTLCHVHGSDAWRLEREGRIVAETPRAEPAPIRREVGELPRIPYLRARCEAGDYALSTPTGRTVPLSVERWHLSTPLGAPPGAASGGLLQLLVLECSGSVDHEYLLTLLRGRLDCLPLERSLLQIGLETLDLALPGAPLPAELLVQPRDSLSSALVKILRAQGYLMRANTQGALHDLDPEYLHDLRVATRRARAALRMVRCAVRLANLEAELSWIGALLGAVRDLDVFTARIDEQLDRSEAAAAFRERILAALGLRRQAAFCALGEAMQGERYVRLIDRLSGLQASALEPPEVTPAGGDVQSLDHPARAFAVEAIKRALDKAGAGFRRSPGDLEPEGLHRQRIRLKRLRYACEFFRPLLGPDLRPVLKTLVALQDSLGTHQDARTALEWVAELARLDPALGRNPVMALDLGSLLQVQREIMAAQRRALDGLRRKGSEMGKQLRSLLARLARECGGAA